VEVDVQVERATKALDDGHRTRAPIAPPRCLGPFPVEAEQRTRANRKHGAAKLVIPGEAIAKLEWEAQDPLANGDPREYMVHEIRGTLGHTTPPAARTEASPLAGKCNQTLDAHRMYLSATTHTGAGTDTDPVLTSVAGDGIREDGPFIPTPPPPR